MHQRRAAGEGRLQLGIGAALQQQRRDFLVSGAVEGRIVGRGDCIDERCIAIQMITDGVRVARFHFVDEVDVRVFTLTVADLLRIVDHRGPVAEPMLGCIDLLRIRYRRLTGDDRVVGDAAET